MKTLPHVNNDVYIRFMNNQPFSPAPVVPVLPDNPDALAFQVYKLLKEDNGKYSGGLDILHKEIIGSLDDEIYTRLANSGGIKGSTSIPLQMLSATVPTRMTPSTKI